MAASQFTIYTSNDVNGPGPINGLTGSLLSVLNACLVNGYTNKPAAGWTKPLSDLSGSLGCFQQASGSRLILFVNDGPGSGSIAPIGTEAWATGWEQITSITNSFAPQTSYTGSVGAGIGQFPTPAQLLTTGRVVWRKTVFGGSTTPRYWIIAADASTMYIWIQAGDIAGAYYQYGFGDVYSLGGANDVYRCFIQGKATDGTTGASDYGDTIQYPGSLASGATIATPGHFMARTFGGSGASITITRKGDVGSSQSTTNTVTSGQMAGFIACPNGPDNSYYFSPLGVIENTIPLVRGRFRGIYQCLHQSTNFSDGQVIQGSNDFTGKTFMIITPGSHSGFWVLEISNTVETN